MQAHVCSIDIDMWDIIQNYFDLSKKKPFEYTEGEKLLVKLDWKAKNIFYCALNPTEFNRVSSCESANDIWKKLIITYE